MFGVWLKTVDDARVGKRRASGWRGRGKFGSTFGLAA
jgi:hypothetical protein